MYNDSQQRNCLKRQSRLLKNENEFVKIIESYFIDLSEKNLTKKLKKEEQQIILDHFSKFSKILLNYIKNQERTSSLAVLKSKLKRLKFTNDYSKINDLYTGINYLKDWIIQELKTRRTYSVYITYIISHRYFYTTLAHYAYEYIISSKAYYDVELRYVSYPTQWKACYYDIEDFRVDNFINFIKKSHKELVRNKPQVKTPAKISESCQNCQVFSF